MANEIPGTVSTTSIATSVTSSYAHLTSLITSSSYLAGLGFSVASIMKFKQHNDNPTQIPIGTPIALIYVSAALLYLPTVLGTANAAAVEEKVTAAAADPAAVPAEAVSAVKSAGITSSDVAAAKKKLTS
jgi:intracellular multiplication protein IcmD